MAQLVIVSNRVAVPDENANDRAGGLEVAVNAALKRKSGIWFGWSGKVTTRTKIATREVVHGNVTYITLDLSKEDHQEYYNGFANRVLWPILHYRIDLAAPSEPHAAVALERRPQRDFEPAGAFGAIAGRNRNAVGNDH